MHKLCPFCHTWCSNNIYDEHIAGHMQKAADGQMKDHVTVRAEERFAGDIAKEPRWYVHPKCGGVTGMPEEIIRSYVVDPFLYNESSFCTGCHGYVATAELFWQETNESLQGSSYRRKAEFIKKNNLNPDDFVWDSGGPVRRKSRSGGAGLGLAAVFVVGGGLAALLLLGFAFLIGLYSFRHQARRPAAPPINAGMPNFQPAFQPMKFPEMPPMNMPKGPDIDKIIRESNERMKETNERMQKQLEESRQRQDQLLEDIRSKSFPGPGAFAPPSLPAQQGLQTVRPESKQPASGLKNHTSGCGKDSMLCKSERETGPSQTGLPEAAMNVPTRHVVIASLALGVFLLTGCESSPEAGPVAVRVAPVAAAAPASPQASPMTVPPVSPSPTESNTAPPPVASGGFSLPIGADIPPAAETPAKEPLPVPPLAQQPQQNPPQPISPQQTPPVQPQSPPATSSAGSPAPAPGKFIHLSAGIAVPQSLPIGTVMALSVDYSLSAEPRASHYLWVVKSAAGEIVNEVKLESSGNLSAFFQQLKPEHRPFSVRIEKVVAGSKSRSVISNELTLKTDY